MTGLERQKILDQLYAALADYRAAEGEEARQEARARMQLALERVALVPGLLLEARP